MTYKIAYLISAYKDPEHLQRLISALAYGVEEYVCFFVHIDAKVEEKPFLPICNKENVFFTPNRFWVQWGGYSQVLYQKELLRCAFETEKGQVHFSRFVIMTGQDYPLLSNAQMFNWYKSHPLQQIISGINLTKNLPKECDRITIYHFLRDTYFRNVLYQRIASAVCRNVMKIIPIRKRPYLLIDGQKWDIWMSSSYMCLTHDCAEYVYQMMNRKDICNYFKYSFVPEEMLIPTIVFNSEWRRDSVEVKENAYSGLISISMLEEFVYGKQIKVFNEDDIKSLLDSGKFFCRKVQSGHSNKLMDILDSFHMNSVE